MRRFLLYLVIVLCVVEKARTQDLFYISNEFDYDAEISQPTLWGFDLETRTSTQYGELSFDHSDFLEKTILSAALHPNGKFYITSSLRLYEVNISQLSCKTVYQIADIASGFGNSLAFDDRGQGYAGNTSLYLLDVDNIQGGVVRSRDFPREILDYIYYNNSLYGLEYRGAIEGPFSSFVELGNFPTPRVVFNGSAYPDVFLTSITKIIKDCEVQFLAVSEASKLYWLDTLSQTLDFIADLNGQYINGLASSSEFFNALQLDLDEDDSAGRIGAAFAAESICDLSSPLADQDVKLFFCNNFIDSIHIQTVQGAGVGSIDFATLPQGTQVTLSSSDELHFNTSGVELSTLENWIAQMSFELFQQEDIDIQVQFTLFADQDTTRSSAFLTFQKNTESREQLIRYCPDDHIQLSSFLPASSSGGNWIDDTRSGHGLFAADIDTPGFYRYSWGLDPCLAVYSFQLIASEMPSSFFPDDTTACQDSGISLIKHPSISSISWPDGSTDDVYTLTESGDYDITYQIDGCLQTERIQVNLDGLVQFRDTIFSCDPTSKLIDLSFYKDGYHILWPDGDTNFQKKIDRFQTIPIELYARAGTCDGHLDLQVMPLGDCDDCQVYFPNAITPNGDGNNDSWSAYGNCLGEQSLQIYNRWGGLVFSSQGDALKWIPANTESGVYLYHLRYTDNLTGKTRVKVGDIIVLP